MKKLIGFILLAIAFTACSDDPQLEVSNRTFTVTDNMWEAWSDQSGSYLFCEFNEPLLTYDVINNGMAVGYFYYSMNNVNIQTPLPFSDFWVDENGYKWEEQLTVEFNPGHVTFILKLDDHAEDHEGNPLLPQYSEYQFLVKILHY